MLIDDTTREQPGAQTEHSAIARTLPQEAREGLMRAWLALLRERNPGVSWVPVTPEEARS